MKNKNEKTKSKMAQEKSKMQHAGENDACHITGINKYLLKKIKGSAKRAYSKNEWDEER